MAEFSTKSWEIFNLVFGIEPKKKGFKPDKPSLEQDSAASICWMCVSNLKCAKKLCAPKMFSHVTSNQFIK